MVHPVNGVPTVHQTMPMTTFEDAGWEPPEGDYCKENYGESLTDSPFIYGNPQPSVSPEVKDPRINLEALYSRKQSFISEEEIETLRKGEGYTDF